MAKRFIETSFFRDPFVRGLDGAYKGLYIYFFLECSNSGIWEVELDIARIRCGIKSDIKDEEITKLFEDKIEVLDNGQKWFLKNFVKLQHNGVLKDNNRAHAGAILELKKYGLLNEFSNGEYEILDNKKQGASEGLPSPTGNGNGKSSGNGNGKKTNPPEKKFTPPTEKEVVDYFAENGYREDVAKRAFKYYSEAKWQDSRGRQVKVWKSKMIAVWFKDENKIPDGQNQNSEKVVGRQNEDTVKSNYSNFLGTDNHE